MNKSKKVRSLKQKSLASDTYGDAEGGFHDLASFRSELGADVAGLSDVEAMRIVDENLVEKSKLPADVRARFDAKEPAAHVDTVYKDMAENMRIKADREEQERRRIAAELAAEKASHLLDKNSLLGSQTRLRDELELEKMKRLYGDRYVWRSPSSFDDYLVKERLKREVKDELLEEKRKVKRQEELNKLWASDTEPKSRARSRSKPKPKSPRARSKPKAKSPKSKPKPKSPKSKAKSRK